VKGFLFFALLAGGYGIGQALGLSAGWSAAIGWGAFLLLVVAAQKLLIALAWHLRLGETGKNRALYGSLSDDEQAHVAALMGVDPP
jgi:hypothetical protein